MLHDEMPGSRLRVHVILASQAYNARSQKGRAGWQRVHKRDCGAFLLQRGQKCGQSNNFWENYEEDIARVVSLNASVFRLSLGALIDPAAPFNCTASLSWCCQSALMRPMQYFG